MTNGPSIVPRRILGLYGRKAVKSLVGKVDAVFIPTDNTVVSALSIEQNLALAFSRGARRGFCPGVKRQDRQIFRDALQRLDLGLENRMGDRVGLLSGGQRQALHMGNRLIMLHRGRIILDICAAEKKALTQEDLVARFYDIQEEDGVTDRMFLG